MSRVIVDPVTRIEGHLRIEAEVDGGKVVDADVGFANEPPQLDVHW